ncbi:MAG: hypothetical protein AMJ93_06235 [Anaerolineae bacterium SM23_84]|nr:MAG: hypothetical protein AMJ93_06235 [Anaerolineae bacterium SM23_84]
MPGLLCIYAHPDDELYCAGLLVKLCSQAIPVHLLCVTRGEGGWLGNPPLATRETIGKVREQEMRCSAEVLGATTLDFLDYIDPVGDGQPKAPRHNPSKFRAQISKAIERLSPEVVLTHGSDGEYGHPAHKLVHRVVRDAVILQGNTAPLLYSFSAFHESPGRYSELNMNDRAHFVLDISPYYEKVVAAFECHRSQWGGWIRHTSDETSRPVTLADYVSSEMTEAFRRHWPPAKGIPDDTMPKWLEG